MTLIAGFQEGIHYTDTGESSVSRYSCINCKRVYKNKHHIKRHVQLECGQQKQFQCPVCGKSMTRKETLVIHLHMIHQMRLKGTATEKHSHSFGS